MGPLVMTDILPQFRKGLELLILVGPEAPIQGVQAGQRASHDLGESLRPASPSWEAGCNGPQESGYGRS